MTGADADPFDVLVDRATKGDRPSLEALMPVVYAELRRLAAHYLRGERPGQTLQPTALVHEAYLKLLKDRPERWQNRAHFCAIAAHSMRQILIERARARDALKRGGGQPRVTFDEGLQAAAPERSFDIVALDAALDQARRRSTPTRPASSSCASSAGSRSRKPPRPIGDLAGHGQAALGARPRLAGARAGGRRV